VDLTRHDFAAIADQYGTPFYLYDIDEAADHLAAFQAGLPDNVDVLYCMKANPNPRIVAMYRELVPGLDISSGGEVELAMQAGWSADVMSFAGPGKTDEELTLAIENHIGSLSIESLSELQRAAAIADNLNATAGILLRINPESIPKGFAMKMGGIASQFGIPEENIDEAVELAKSLPGIDLRGFHIFSGTQCLSLDAATENIKQTLDISQRLSEKHQITPAEINLGGGVGVAYFPGQEDIDPGELSSSLAALIIGFRREFPRLADTRMVIELGRYLIGRYGVYVTHVIDVKETRGKRFTVLNGGMNHCFPATGNFGQLIKKNYPTVNLSRDADQVDFIKQEIVGPLCTPLDSMARSLLMAPAEVGDMVAFNNCGAYSYSASPLMFLSHKTPIELIYRHGKITIGRRRLSAADFV
jgi:diaminopimelate decarboxylase